VLALWLVFAGLYFSHGWPYIEATEEDDAESRGLKFRPLQPVWSVLADQDDRCGPPRRFSSLRLSLQLSALLLLKIGRGDLRLEGTAPRLLVFAAWTQWLAGYLILIGLLITVGNTQPFLNQVLKGVF